MHSDAKRHSRRLLFVVFRLCRPILLRQEQIWQNWQYKWAAGQKLQVSVNRATQPGSKPHEQPCQYASCLYDCWRALLSLSLSFSISLSPAVPSRRLFPPPPTARYLSAVSVRHRLGPLSQAVEEVQVSIFGQPRGATGPGIYIDTASWVSVHRRRPPRPDTWRRRRKDVGGQRDGIRAEFYRGGVRGGGGGVRGGVVLQVPRRGVPHAVHLPLRHRRQLPLHVHLEVRLETWSSQSMNRIHNSRLRCGSVSASNCLGCQQLLGNRLKNISSIKEIP